MDCFQVNINNDKPIELNVSNYEKATKKKEPYFQIVNKKMKHYAVCPACKNPLDIINLYVDKTFDENSNKMPLHAKHYNLDVVGIANYSKDDYLNCPFANPAKFGGREKRKSKNKKNEIITLLQLYPNILFNEIRSITGIDFSVERFQELISNFILSEGYYYRYITKYNLPYGFLNMQKNINIFNNRIFPSNTGKKLQKELINSKYFKYKYNRIVRKTDKFAEISFYLSNHRFNGDREEEYIDLMIEEKQGSTENLILRESIKINYEKYINMIEKQKKIFEITSGLKLE